MNLGENSVLPKMHRQQHDFSEPGRGREIGLRSRLDFHRTIGDTGHTWTSLLRTVVFVLFKEAYFYVGWLLITPRCASRGQSAGMRPPRSQTTVWKILRQAGCIEEDLRRKPRPLKPRQPGEEVQFDLKDESLVPADPEGKRQHVVEIANFVDAGTSIWLHRLVGAEFDAEGLLEVVAQFLCEHGLPAMLTFDNDPRFVGSSSGRDFPSALVRFLLCW